MKWTTESQRLKLSKFKIHMQNIKVNNLFTGIYTYMCIDECVDIWNVECTYMYGVRLYFGNVEWKLGEMLKSSQAVCQQNMKISHTKYWCWMVGLQATATTKTTKSTNAINIRATSAAIALAATYQPTNKLVF